MKRSAKLNTYRNNSRLTKRIPDFQVKLGFGLHVGWAIEGAIGSEYKAGRCRLTASEPVLKAPMVTALESTIC